jgi:hypothetical protein
MELKWPILSAFAKVTKYFKNATEIITGIEDLEQTDFHVLTSSELADVILAYPNSIDAVWTSVQETDTDVGKFEILSVFFSII